MRSEQAISHEKAKFKTASVWIKLIVVFHVYCITVWSCPKPNDALMNGRVKPFGSDIIRLNDQKVLKAADLVQAYLFTTGTWQYWDMFAPNPANVDTWCDAIVIYKDGSRRHYQYPRMFLLPIPEKYLKERFRKFFERAGDPKDYAVLPPVFGLRIALLNYTDPKNPPVTVKVYLHTKLIAEPGKPQPTSYTENNFYTYEVDREKLLKAAKESH